MDKYTIENLELFYGDFKALKNINMKIQEKEIVKQKFEKECLQSESD